MPSGCVPLRAAIVLMLCLGTAAGAQPCQPFVEEHSGGTSASFRPHANAFQPCEVDEETLHRVIAVWLRARPIDAPALSSLGLGRAVNHPWLSQALTALALHDPRWLAQARRAKRMERDRLLAILLKDPGLLQRLGRSFEDTPYELRGVGYEKVLWRKVQGAEVPFDAQLWLRVAPRRQGRLTAPGWSDGSPPPAPGSRG